MAYMRYLWYSNLALTILERAGNLIMVFLIANMNLLQKFKTIWPPHGLEEAHLVHRLGLDQFRDVPHPSQPKFDLARPPHEGFRSISLKAWEP